MLSKLLKMAKEAELEALFLSVEKENEPSIKTIIAIGGIFEHSFEFEGKQADIYKIIL